MTDEVRPGESRRDIAGNSLRALRGARGGGRPAADSAAADSAADSTAGPAEVFDDPAELTDDPAVQPDDDSSADDLPPATPDEAYADEVLDAETEAETDEAGSAGHDDTDDPTIDDPSELTDDPSGLSDNAASASTDNAGTPDADHNADAGYADEVLEVDPATDTNEAEPAAAGDADAAYADEVLEVDPATDTDDSPDAAAQGHDDTDDPTVDDPAELTDDPAGEPESPEARAVSRVADPVEDEPPTLAAATPRSRRSKVRIDKGSAASPAADSVAGDSSTTTARPAATPKRPRRRPAPLVIALAAVTTVALVFAVVSAVVWYRADNDDAREIATARNDVATEARLAVATVNTIDYTKASASLDQWLSVSTGKLRSQVSDSKASAAKILAQAKTSTTAVVLDAAVTSLDTGKGTATVILAVNLSKKAAGKPAVSDRKRFRASMKLVNGEWKLADLGEVQPAVFS